MFLNIIVGKSFDKKVNLEGHVNRIHVKERKYPCSRCSEAFFDAKALKVHLDQHDGLNQQNISVFKSKFLCDWHVKSVHDKNEICGLENLEVF